MWNKLSIQLARLMHDVKAAHEGRGFDILRTELGLYPRTHLKEKRKAINKYSNEYLGFKPFKEKKNKNYKSAEKKLLKLAQELKQF